MIHAQETAQQRPLVLIVDDDSGMRDAVGELMLSIGMDAAGYGSTKELLAKDLPDRPGCLVLDVRMPGISGLDLQKQLNARGVAKPIIFLTAYADVPMTVEAMKAGAVNFFTKPFRDQALLDAVGQAIEIDLRQRELSAQARRNAELFSSLTPRERQVFEHVAEGKLNKQIAYSLEISEVTVKLHRGNVMRKMQVRSLAELMKAWSTLPQD